MGAALRRSRGPAVVLLTTALLRSPLPRTTGVVASTAATGVLIVVAAGSSGPNTGKPCSDRGQSFGNHLPASLSKVELSETTPHLGEVSLRDAKLWIALAAAIAAFGRWRRRHHRGVLLRPERGLLIATALPLVTGVVVVFVLAPFRQAPG
ncbi:hypothetical protein EIL87_01940 [Saccharopolyspora rhizosphaerae]|uniref:Uncharacterized protein n=1 Tax=Saccharopolyspora rhizosphaerae TaxID=2492662 RepID=A0A3R8QAL3_9PSEU|nr:hypothetical protein [Saccharopolyspora rhizosphaerae]RRO20652.1 hypothetical protein EIL87_01940 [Saccharopolyspora rhizosphaerae]